MTDDDFMVEPTLREAEMGLLGCLLREPEVASEVAQIVSRVHFHHAHHQDVFSASIALFGDSKPVDVVSVYEELCRTERITSLGGPLKTSELLKEIRSAYCTNPVYYAEIVKRHATKRFLHAIGRETASDSQMAHADPSVLINQASEKLDLLMQRDTCSAVLPLSKCLGLATDWLDRRQQGNSSDGVLTGFADLDEKTGGMHDGELTLIAARPSVGKTALACSIARNVGQRGWPVFFVSLEQSATELGMRFLCCEAGVDGNSARRGAMSNENVRRCQTALNTLEKCRVFIDDTPGQNVMRIVGQAKRLRKSEGIRLVIVDYLQLIDMESRRGETREQQVAAVSRRLKVLSRELRIPVVALAQLNRQVEHRGEEKPKLSDLRDSGSLEQDADSVLMLWRPEGRESNLVQILVEKQRNGPTGAVTLTFIRHCMRFENHAVDVYH